MELNKKIELVAEILDLEVGEFELSTKLIEIEEWDSLAAISYMVMMDEHFDVTPSAENVRSFKTIQDVINSMEKK